MKKTNLASNGNVSKLSISQVQETINHPVRVKLIKLLKKHSEGLSMTEITKQIPSPSLPILSQHIGVLRQSSLILTERDGRSVKYQLNPQYLTKIESSIAKIKENRLTKIEEVENSKEDTSNHPSKWRVWMENKQRIENVAQTLKDAFPKDFTKEQLIKSSRVIVRRFKKLQGMTEGV